METSSRFPPRSPHETAGFAFEATVSIGSVSLEKELSDEERIEDPRCGMAWLLVCASGGWRFAAEIKDSNKEEPETRTATSPAGN